MNKRETPWAALQAALSAIDPMIVVADYVPARDRLIEIRQKIESAMLGINETKERRSNSARNRGGAK